jgi:hypothetical protein
MVLDHAGTRQVRAPAEKRDYPVYNGMKPGHS